MDVADELEIAHGELYGGVPPVSPSSQHAAPREPHASLQTLPPGKQYFGYEVGFAERVSGTHRGHPDLTDEERNTCIMAAIPPGFAIGVGSDYSSYLCLTPAGADAVHIRSGLFRFSDDWPSSATDDAIRLFEETMQEDKAVLEPMHRALSSRFYQPGPLAGADLGVRSLISTAIL